MAASPSPAPGLEESQWWPAARLLDHQLARLRELVAHAQRTVPWQRERLRQTGLDAARPFAWEDWLRMPVMTRREVQEHESGLVSNAIPPALGQRVTNQTSGSTGTPVRVHGTANDARIFRAVTQRHYQWHPHDFSERYAVIRRMSRVKAEYPAGLEQPAWGDRALFPFPTGPAALLSVRASIAEQAEWLARQNPGYLLTYPSNLQALAEHCLERSIALPRLRHAASIGEVVSAGARDACRAAWSAPVIDTYSAEEVGVIAHQCPAHEHLHVQGETVLAEIVDDAGRPCPPGAVGRVLVTPLYNYAMPLMRYHLGDYAEAGAPCPCGRGLPVIARVLGRERNSLLVTASGERYWPAFGSRGLTGVAPVRQHQFVQTALDTIVARLVTAAPLSPAEEDSLRRHVLAQLPPGFRLELAYCDDIPRNAGGKFENFISLVGGHA